MDLYSGNFLSKYGKLHIKLIIIKCLFFTSVRLSEEILKDQKTKVKLENAPLSKEKGGVVWGLQNVLVFFLIPIPPV